MLTKANNCSLYNSGTASSNPCLWPITDTESPVWAHMLRSTFLKLVTGRVQMSIKLTISNTFLSMTRDTYFLKTVGGSFF